MSPNELNTTLTPHSIIHGHACFAYFNKIWGIPTDCGGRPSKGLPQDIPPRGLCRPGGWSSRIRLWLILWLWLSVLLRLLRATAVLELLQARKRAYYLLPLSPTPRALLPATLFVRKLLRA